MIKIRTASPRRGRRESIRNSLESVSDATSVNSIAFYPGTGALIGYLIKTRLPPAPRGMSK